MNLEKSHVDAPHVPTSGEVPRSKSGKIAVKVINHYGDEVLRVLGV